MKEDNKQSAFSSISSQLTQYVRKNYSVIILIFATLLATTVISVVNSFTATTVSSIDPADYEAGQISDISITARRDLPADAEHSVGVSAGERILRKGFPVTEEALAKLNRMADAPVYIDYRALANSVIFHILLCALFFVFYSKVYFESRDIEFKEIALGCCCYLVIFAAVILGQKFGALSNQFAICTVIPVTLCVFLIAILFGQLDTVFFGILASLCVLNASSYQIVPFIFVLATSLSSARLVRRIDRRTDMVLVAGLQALLNCVFLVILQVIFNDPVGSRWGVLVGAALNGVFSGILCLGLLTPLELLLNTASIFRLMDLSDLNSPLMRKMLLTASGTYSHSLMVANLAEAACNEIGANPLVARVGAYYHDIGKLDNPEYFVENQTGENIHNDITPSLSVSIIRSHVKRGVERARALRFPKQIIDIISEHHGNQVIAYFYNEAKSITPDANPEDYSYTGKPPSTKESAVVMLADTVEAACRTLDKPSVPRLEKFIKTLINGKIEQKQLDNCNLSFADLAKIQESFVQTLAGYYHSRTKYPDQRDPDTNKAVSDDSGGGKKLAAPDSDTKKSPAAADSGAAAPAEASPAEAAGDSAVPPEGDGKKDKRKAD